MEFGTWRIIPVSKWLVTPIYKPFGPFGRGITLLGDLLTMVINHLLNGMILQVVGIGIWYIICLDLLQKRIKCRVSHEKKNNLPYFPLVIYIGIRKSADPSRRDWQISYAESKRCRSILILTQNPKSKIRNPKSKIQNPKSKIQNPKSKIRNPKSKIQNPNGAVWGRHKKNED